MSKKQPPVSVRDSSKQRIFSKAKRAVQKRLSKAERSPWDTPCWPGQSSRVWEAPACQAWTLRSQQPNAKVESQALPQCTSRWVRLSLSQHTPGQLHRTHWHRFWICFSAPPAQHKEDTQLTHRRLLQERPRRVPGPSWQPEALSLFAD